MDKRETTKNGAQGVKECKEKKNLRGPSGWSLGGGKPGSEAGIEGDGDGGGGGGGGG